MFLYCMIYSNGKFGKVGITSRIMMRHWQLSYKTHDNVGLKLLLCFPVKSFEQEKELIKEIRFLLIGNTEWFEGKNLDRVLSYLVSFYNPKIKWPKEWLKNDKSIYKLQDIFYYKNLVDIYSMRKFIEKRRSMSKVCVDFQNLEKEIKKLGVAKVSADLGFRDTGRVKNWMIRKAIPKEFKLVVSSYLKKGK